MYCGELFMGAKPFGKFCSDNCRVYYNSEKKAFEAGVKEELPVLLKRVKEAMGRVAEKDDLTQQDLDRAIATIAKSQKTLDEAKIQLKSFEDFFVPKNKR
jgi:hypothetical protein